MKFSLSVFSFLCCLFVLRGYSQVPNRISYQGLLTTLSGAPVADGAYSFQFDLFDSLSGGTSQWSEIQPGDSVRHGTFSVALGSVTPLNLPFSKTLFLQVKATAGPAGPSYPLTFSPRTELLSSPYAFRAKIADSLAGGVTGNFLPLAGGQMTGAITNAGDPPIKMGKGNFGSVNTNAGIQAFVAGFNNTASAQYSTVSGGQYNTSSGASATIGGGEVNLASFGYSTVGGGANNSATWQGATVGGGIFNKARGQYSVVSGGGGANAADSNSAIGDYSTIAGGRSNHSSDTDATVSGGAFNASTGIYSFVGGGEFNNAHGKYSVVSGGGGAVLQPNSAMGDYSAIGGGWGNLTSNQGANVVGGYHNTSSGAIAAIAGGQNNVAGGFAAAIGGGDGNIANGNDAAIGGGYTNSAGAEGASVAGGVYNVASGYSSTVAGGYLNKARGQFSVVGGGGGLAFGDSNSAMGTNSTIGGGARNLASGDSATVAGGASNRANGNSSSVGGGRANTTSAGFSTVGGGYSNIASGGFATAGGGYSNIAGGSSAVVGGGSYDTASADYATISGGYQNSASGMYSSVGGGTYNSANNTYGTVGGGNANRSTGFAATIGGGNANTSSNSVTTVSGGYSNSASNLYATVGGGSSNSANGKFSTVPGGSANTAAGTYSLAAGQQANAMHNGTFVWADSENTDFASTGINQFLIRAAGGVGIGTNSPASNLHVKSFDATGNGVQARVSNTSTIGNSYAVFSLDAKNGDIIALSSCDGLGTGPLGTESAYFGTYTSHPIGFVTGNAERMRINTAGLVGIGTTAPGYLLQVGNNGDGSQARANAWNTFSDQRFKKNVNVIGDALDKVTRLRGVSFDWIKSGEHSIGFIAQEVEAVLPEIVSTDKDGYKSLDYAKITPVLVEAIKEMGTQNEALHREVEQLVARTTQLEAIVKSLAAKQQDTANKSIGALRQNEK